MDIWILLPLSGSVLFNQLSPLSFWLLLSCSRKMTAEEDIWFLISRDWVTARGPSDHTTCMCGFLSPPLLAASTASGGRPNWLMRGPSCPEAKALLNILMDWRREESQSHMHTQTLLWYFVTITALLPAGTEGSWVCSESLLRSVVNSLLMGGRAAAAAGPQRWSGWVPSSQGYKHSQGPLKRKRGGPIDILSPFLSNIVSMLPSFPLQHCVHVALIYFTWGLLVVYIYVSVSVVFRFSFFIICATQMHFNHPVSVL